MGIKSSRNLGPEPLQGKQPATKLTEKYIERIRKDRMQHLKSKIDTSEISIEVNNVQVE